MSSHHRDKFVLEPLERRQLLSAGPHLPRGTVASPPPADDAYVLSSRGGAGSFAAAEDVGSPALSGSTAYDNGTYTIVAGGADIGGASDQFHFAYNNWDDDGSIVARVGSLANTNAAAKAGVMFRSGTGADAAFAGVFVTPSAGLMLITRSADGGGASQSTLFGFPPPRFLRLARAGNQITAFHSANGLAWTQVGSPQTVALGPSPLVGLAVTSRSAGATTTATFTNVSLLLPPNYNDNDVGSPALPGFVLHDPSQGTFVVTGAGSGVGGTSDQFNFANHNVTGDGSIAALVHDLDATSTSGRAGVMFRDELTGGAKFASLARTPANDLVFQWRASTGAPALSTSVANVTGAVWLRLTRTDDVFRADYSTTGLQWTPIGASQSIVMTSATAPGGVFVTSGEPSTLASAAFAPVNIAPRGWTSAPVGNPALLGSATYDAPSNTHTLVGGGSGIGAEADEFNFASRTISGDGTVIAYVNGFTGDATDARAGVMVRAAASATSAFAAVMVSRQGSVSFQWRETEGGPMQSASVGGVVAPVSLRLTRAGNSFTAAYSTNGTTWSTIGSSRTVVMPGSALAGLALTSQASADLARATFSSVGVGKNLPPGAGIYSSSDELFLHDLSQRSVRFFYDETNPNTGLVLDGAGANGGNPSAVSSIAAIGFGLSALAIADERGFLARDAAYQRALTTVNFLYNNVPHVNGWFYHFLNPATGQRDGNTELSSIDTALLLAGVLNVAQHWPGTALATTATNLFNRVDFPWFQTPSGQFRGAWFPQSGFTSHVYGDFSEAALIYLLGLGSPTHPVSRSSWLSWSRSPVINYSGFNFVTAGTRALFTVQYPQGWFDLRGLTDATGLNFYNNAATATLAQRQMGINLSGTWPQYGANNWGWTAADGPTGYTVWGGPPPTSNIEGSLVPTAPGGSLGFTPRQSLDALRHMHATYGSTVYKRYGFVDAFNPHTNWTSSIVLGIDVGMMLLAAENARSNFIWDEFNSSAPARQAVASAFNQVTPVLVGASSRKPATGGASSDLPLNITAEGDAAVENRQGGPTQLVLHFGANIVKGPSFNVTLASGTVTSSTVNGSTLTIDLAGVVDAQTLVINVSDVRHFANTASGSYALNLGVLLADANQDRRVNLADFNVLAGRFGQSATSSAQGDFNFDGVVNLADFNLLASQFGKTLAAPLASASITPFFGGSSRIGESDDDGASTDRIADQVLV